MRSADYVAPSAGIIAAKRRKSRKKTFVAAARQSAANFAFDVRLSAESRYVGKNFLCLLRLFAAISFLCNR